MSGHIFDTAEFPDAITQRVAKPMKKKQPFCWFARARHGCLLLLGCLFLVNFASAQTTTTTLTASANPVNVGDTVTLTAKVTGTGLGGTMTFKDGANVLTSGAVPALNGTYTLNLQLPFSSAGTHALTAVYTGTPANSTSAVLNLVVNASTTTSTTLTSSVNPSIVGANTTLSAKVTGSGLGGTITFKDGATTLSSGTVPAGTNGSYTLNLQVPFSTAGAHTLTAVYSGTPANSTSAALTQTVNTAPTSGTTLTSSVNPSTVGQSTTLKATVAGTSPTGTVVFKDGSTTLNTATLSAGSATFAASFSTVGTHSLTAVYSGDANNPASTSTALSQSVVAAGNTTTTLTSSLNPMNVGQSTTLTMQVTGNGLGGTVVLKDGATTLFTQPVPSGGSGYTFNLTLPFTTVGAHSLTAVYTGTPGNSTSAALVETVNALPPTLSADVNPAFVGQDVVLSSTVIGTNLSGTVSLLDGTTVLGTIPATGGTGSFTANFTRRFSVTGAHNLTAKYDGDPLNPSGTSAVLVQTINPPVVTLTSNANPSYPGQSFTLTATATGGRPSGLVTFKDGGAVLGTANLNGGGTSSGSTTWSGAFPSTGTHALTAEYDVGDGTKSIGSLTQTVQTGSGVSSVVVTSSTNPVYFGVATALKATVTGTAPKGYVTFKEGATVLGTGVLTGGVATLNASFATPGAHSVTAVYAGDNVNAASTSGAFAQSVSAPTLVVASNVNPAYPGQSFNISVTVTAGVGGGTSPSGTVTLTDGSTTLGSTFVDGGGAQTGVANFVLSYPSTGARTLTASYAGNDGGVAQGTLSQNVTTGSGVSSLVLTSDANPVYLGKTTVITAKVTGVSTPQGLVTFKDGATVLGTSTLNIGSASLSTSLLGTGTHSLTATYAGDNLNAPSGGSLAQVVNPLSTTATVLSSSVNPSFPGQASTFTATVTGATPTGSVTFMDGAITLGSSQLGFPSGTAASATLPFNWPSSGTHSLTAVYSGDSNNKTSTSSAMTQTVKIGTGVSQTVLSSSANPSFVGNAVTLTITVTGSTPAGTVKVVEGANSLGMVQLNASGVGTLTVNLPAGVHTLAAQYQGDNANATSTGNLTQTVNTANATTTTLTSGTNPSVPGQATLLTISVTGQKPGGGYVTIKDGATTLGSAFLPTVAGTTSTTTYSATFADVGSHNLTAVYGGDSGNAGSTSPAMVQTVKIGTSPSTTALTSATNPSYGGAPVTLTATVTGTTPSGPITFMDGATFLGTQTLSNGVASLTTNFYTPGTHSLVAKYAGDSVNAASTSATLAQVANAAAATTTTLTSGINPSSPNQTTVLTFKVTGVSPSGVVSIWDGSTLVADVYLAPATGASSTGTYSASFPAAGSHNLTAKYAGDNANAPSTSGVLLQSVQAGSTPTTTALTSSINPVSGSNAVLLRATITGSNPTGTVAFMDGATVLGTQVATAGIATLTKSFSSAGTHNLSALYSGDTLNASSTGTLAQIVTAAATSATTMSSPVNPSRVGPISILVTVTGSSPTGGVQLVQSDRVIATGTLTSSNATTSVATLQAVLTQMGSFNLKATYGGDASNFQSESPVTVQIVDRVAATSVALTTTPSVIAVGQSATLRATVTGINPTGGIIFMDGSTRLGTVPLASGTASLNTSFAAPGVHNLIAIFSGDENNEGSTSTTLAQTVDVATNATVLLSSNNPAYVGQSIALTASVKSTTASAATGTVTFKDGTTTLGSQTLVNGSATLSTTFAVNGSHPLTAVYGGDGSNPASTSDALSQTIANRAVTSTTVESNVGSVGIGQTLTLSAKVARGLSPTGTMTFKDGATALGNAEVHDGEAQFLTRFTTAGAHTITAEYGGDIANAGSTSPAISQNVGAFVPSTTTLASSVNPSSVGQTTVLTATVTGTLPTGNVTFKDGAAVLGTGAVDASGSASFIASFSATGSHSLSAVYAGDGGNTSSTSIALAQTVGNSSGTLPTPPVSPVPVVNYEYDAEGNPTKRVLAPGVTGFGFATQTGYDTLDRPTLITDAKAGTIKQGFDGQDRLTQVIDPRNLTTSMPRTGLGDVTSLASPDTGTATNTYDANGNLKTVTDSRGVLATLGYDNLDRLTSIVYTQSSKPTQSYGWNYDQIGAGFSNGIGRLTSSTYASGSSQFSYDALGRLLTETRTLNPVTGANTATLNLTVGYSYDPAGNVTAITYPSGRQVSIGYANGQPSTLGLADSAGGLVSPMLGQIRYVPFGGVVSWQWQMSTGAQQMSRIYDTSGRLVRYPLGANVRDLTFDAAGRISAYTHYDATTGATSAATTALNQGFGYDELGRLTSVSMGTSTWAFGYDATGNRTRLTLNGGTPSVYTIATTSNRLTSIATPARSFTYDATGNTTVDTTSGNASASYTSVYGTGGRLDSLTKNSVVTTFDYDAKGLRVRKFSSSGAASTVVFAYDQSGQLLGEYDSTGKALREYIWLDNTPVAMFTPDATNAANPPVPYFIQTDHLNTPRVVVNKSNQVRWRWMAEPFGTTAPETNPASLGAFTQNLRFPGQYADQETGLNYNSQRDYDATLGRYVQSDPIGLEGGINTYLYADASPQLFADPSGLVASLDNWWGHENDQGFKSWWHERKGPGWFSDTDKGFNPKFPDDIPNQEACDALKAQYDAEKAEEEERRKQRKSNGPRPTRQRGEKKSINDLIRGGGRGGGRGGSEE